jgi:hypothetical protein
VAEIKTQWPRWEHRRVASASHNLLLARTFHEARIIRAPARSLNIHGFLALKQNDQPPHTLFGTMPDKANSFVEGKKLVSNRTGSVSSRLHQLVIDYYIRIAPVLLPHLKDRPR